MRPYRPRRIQPLGVWRVGEWRFKRYGIAFEERVLDAARIVETRALVESVLPQPVVTATRPGVGVVLLHRGEPREYLVVAWWDHENELPIRLFVRDYAPGAEWRPASGSESICVWDLEVLWFERGAYIGTVLAEGEGGADAYCERFLGASSPGTVAWRDLTVPNADQVRHFYTQVVGWTAEPVSMNGYSDYNLRAPATGEAVAGICHARGVNANLPPQWLVYVSVADLDHALSRVMALGGAVVDGPRGSDSGRVAVIRDPAGAFLALHQD